MYTQTFYVMVKHIIISGRSLSTEIWQLETF